METCSMIRGPDNPDLFPLNYSGIEMTVMPAVSYTSLRDIMPHPNNASWNEIPIRNPLLKQAALAYLQPISKPPEVANKGLFQKLKGKCFCGGRGGGDFGCLGWWLSDGGVFKTLLETFVACFCERRRVGNGEEEDQQHEDEEEEEGGR